MWPVLFTLPEGLPLIGGLQIQSFGVLLFSAFITAGWFARREMARKGLDPERMTDLVFWAIVGGLLGSKLYSAFSNPAALAADPLGQIFSGSGFTWYGGLILATVFVWIYMRAVKLPVGATFDSIAVGLPMGIAVGRIGCFLAGDDYGRPTDVAWGVAFPNGAPPTTVDVLTNRYGLDLDPAFVERFGQVVPVHPTQLYEVALSFVIFALMWKWRLHKHSGGWLFAAWLGVYGVSRFLLETVRLKSDRFLFDTFTGAQVISALLIIASIALTQRLSDRNKATKPKT